MSNFLARLLLIAAVIAPGGDAVLHLGSIDGGAVGAGSTERNQHAFSARPSSAGPLTSTAPAVGDRRRARDMVDRYENALIAGDWEAAFELLSPTSLTREMGLEAFASERAAYFDSAGDRYVLADPARVSDWMDIAPLVVRAERPRAWLVEVTYPALAGNNAGYEQLVVAPDENGTWRIWPVR